MDFDYDVVIIGGAFSGAATALILKRKHPSARVLIIEKAAEFDRKVGESTTEISSCYMTRILGLTQHLGHEQIGKQGLRFWFCKGGLFCLSFAFLHQIWYSPLSRSKQNT